jgi:hypothetical protein
MGEKTGRRTPIPIIAMLLLTSCASVPQYVESEGNVAYLQNRTQRQGQARFDYVFEYANGGKLETGGVIRNPAKLVNKIQAGRVVVGLKITYIPAYGKNLFAMSNDRTYFIFVRDLGLSEERIKQLGEQMPEAAPESFEALRGLTFDATSGQAYQAGCRIEDGRALVWIEEPDGKIVSDTVFGFADAQHVVQTVFERGLQRPGVPNLGGGWKFLDDLPDPVN